MSVYRKIKLISVITILPTLVSFIMIAENLVNANIILAIISIILFGIGALLLAITVEFTTKFNSNSIQSHYVLPFDTLCGHEDILKKSQVSFDSQLVLRINGSLFFEVIMNTQVGTFKQSVPIIFNISTFYQVLSLDNEYFYNKYHEPLAMHLIEHSFNNLPMVNYKALRQELGFIV